MSKNVGQKGVMNPVIMTTINHWREIDKAKNQITHKTKCRVENFLSLLQANTTRTVTKVPHTPTLRLVTKQDAIL